VHGAQSKGSRNCKKAFNLFQSFLRLRQSGAHGTSRACHTLDTPLGSSNENKYERLTDKQKINNKIGY